MLKPSRRRDVRDKFLFGIPAPIISRPFEVWISALCALTGIPMLFGAPAPGSISETLPGWMVTIWGCMFVAGSVGALIGIIGEKPQWEYRAYLYGLGPAASAYGVALFSANGLNSLVVGSICIGLGIACFMRMASIHVVATVKHEVSQALAEAEERI